MKRDSFFDNYKAALILLVVMAHFIGPLAGKSHLMGAAQTSIYSFHMPAFVFITGYFSRNNQFPKLLRTTLLPFVMFQLVYYVMLNYIWGQPSSLQILLPKFTLWYLLSTFCWKLMVDKLLLVRGMIPLAFVLGVLAGFDTTIGALGALGRTITFLPFFLLGHEFQKERFLELTKNKWVRALAATLLIVIFAVIFWKNDHIRFNVLTMKYSYKRSNVLEYGWIYRSGVYLLSTSLIYLIGAVVPREKHWFTYIGQRTMAIYLLHGILYKTLQYRFHLYDGVDTRLEMTAIALLSVGVTLLFSMRPFHELIGSISKIPIERLLRKNETFTTKI